jgi:Uma2 family endonuclease
MSTVLKDRSTRHRITVEEYYRMAEVGLLAPGVRAELINGEIIDMPSIGSPHGGTAAQLTRLFSRALGDAAQLRVELPVRLSEYSELQPDLSIVTSRDDFYKSGHPAANDTLLVVEVSDSRLQYDRDIKVSLYAQCAVPEVWVVDLVHRQVHFYRTLANGNYTDASFTAKPGVIALSALPGVSVDLSGLFAS